MTESQEKSPFVTIENLAQYFCVSVSTIRAWVRQGYIPETTYIKLGNTYRFKRDEVAEALTKMRKEDVDPEAGAVSVFAAGAVGTVMVASQEDGQLEFDFDADDDV